MMPQPVAGGPQSRTCSEHCQRRTRCPGQTVYVVTHDMGLNARLHEHTWIEKSLTGLPGRVRSDSQHQTAPRMYWGP